MKTKILFMLLLCVYCIIHSQENTIYYDFERSGYFVKNTKSELKELTPHELKNNTEYQLKMININPFYYKISLQIKQQDKIKEIFDFLRKAMSGDISPDLKIMNVVEGERDAAFKKLYNEAILIDALLKNSYFSKDIKTKIEKFKKENTLLAAYQSSDNPSSYTFTDVQKLNSLMNDVSYFVHEKHSTMDLGKFTTAGTDYTFELTFTPPEDNSIKQSEKKDVTTFTSKSKFKAYFSSGLFLAAPVNSKYYVSDKNANNAYTIREEDRGKMSLGAMTLAHFLYGFRNSTTKIGFNVGAGIDLDTQLRFLLGGTFMTNNITFNAGYNWAFKEVLSDKLQQDKEYTEQPEIAYKKVLKGGFWLGISYRIF
ncbi:MULTISPECIES: hypothetical protein [Chryseobacterium]|uniref:hypothetical protein n=1 Tax=Chryseobacterium TaxID=59732 RepID=UPI0012975DDE|nr:MULTISPECIES: hypothetical protein [Chryseobacterium]MDR6921234.1 hypothetical protein [Chryseobacterium sp. 2987]